LLGEEDINVDKIKEFIAENRLALLLGLLLLLLICWLHADNHRNDGIHQDTDSTVADIDKRIQSIEGRLDSMQTRLDENQKAVSRIAEGIGRSREKAEIVAGGIDQAEGRLDDAIKRSERIEDLIREIEKANR
jgi:chromosome segregation ATPase